MNSISVIEQSLSQNFAEYLQISPKAPSKSLLQIYWNNASSGAQGTLKIFATINCLANTLISSVEINSVSNSDNAFALLIDAPYQFLRFVYEKTGESSSGTISIICSHI